MEYDLTRTGILDGDKKLYFDRNMNLSTVRKWWFKISVLNLQLPLILHKSWKTVIRTIYLFTYLVTFLSFQWYYLWELKGWGRRERWEGMGRDPGTSDWRYPT